MENNNPYSELLNIVSVMLAIQNLKENREQSAHNDIQAANDEQAHRILEVIEVRFEEQNKEIEKIKSMLYDIVTSLNNMEFSIKTLDYDKAILNKRRVETTQNTTF